MARLEPYRRRLGPGDEHQPGDRKRDAARQVTSRGSAPLLSDRGIKELREWTLVDSKYTIGASPKLSIDAGFEAAIDTID